MLPGYYQSYLYLLLFVFIYFLAKVREIVRLWLYSINMPYCGSRNLQKLFCSQSLFFLEILWFQFSLWCSFIVERSKGNSTAATLCLVVFIRSSSLTVCNSCFVCRLYPGCCPRLSNWCFSSLLCLCSLPLLSPWLDGALVLKLR